MAAEGSFTFPIKRDNDYHTSVHMSLYPKYGYFVLDNFLLRGTADIAVRLLDTNPRSAENERIIWNLGIEGQYYFPTRTQFFPYLGFGFSLGMNGKTLSSLRWNLDFPIGVLWLINDFVGVNLGVPIRLGFAARSVTGANAIANVIVSPGVLGVVGFF